MFSVQNSNILRQKSLMSSTTAQDTLLDLVNLCLFVCSFLLLSLLLVGDLPVLSLRWHLIAYPQQVNGINEHAAVIDRCAVLPSYRNQKLATAALDLVMKDMERVSQHHGVPHLSALHILVPQDSQLEGCLRRHGYQPPSCSLREDTTTGSSAPAHLDHLIIRGGVPHRHLSLSLPLLL
jgi:hypothetical protein